MHLATDVFFRSLFPTRDVHGDMFHNDRHPHLKAAYVLANSPFNDCDWQGTGLWGDGL